MDGKTDVLIWSNKCLNFKISFISKIKKFINYLMFQTNLIKKNKILLDFIGAVNNKKLTQSPIKTTSPIQMSPRHIVISRKEQIKQM